LHLPAEFRRVISGGGKEDRGLRLAMAGSSGDMRSKRLGSKPLRMSFVLVVDSIVGLPDRLLDNRVDHILD
jgi:hypothetical protein